MRRIITVLLTSIFLVGCQGLTSKPQVEFVGYLENPSEPLFIEIQPVKEFLYRTGGASAGIASEKITRKGDSLVKSATFEGDGFRGDLILTVLPNGLVTNFDIDEQTIEFETETLDTNNLELKGLMMEVIEKTGMLDAVQRFPDYALGQKIEPGFVSSCWREEEMFKKTLVSIVNMSLKLPPSKISSKADSECKFLGVTYIQGRQSAVFKESIQASTSVIDRSETASLVTEGWRAIDLQKGLVLEGEYKMVLFVNGQKVNLGSDTVKTNLISISNQ